VRATDSGNDFQMVWTSDMRDRDLGGARGKEIVILILALKIAEMCRDFAY
jgi:hypothetical protein